MLDVLGALHFAWRSSGLQTSSHPRCMFFVRSARLRCLAANLQRTALRRRRPPRRGFRSQMVLHSDASLIQLLVEGVDRMATADLVGLCLAVQRGAFAGTGGRDAAPPNMSAAIPRTSGRRCRVLVAWFRTRRLHRREGRDVEPLTRPAVDVTDHAVTRRIGQQ